MQTAQLLNVDDWNHSYTIRKQPNHSNHNSNEHPQMRAGPTQGKWNAEVSPTQSKHVLMDDTAEHA